MCPSNILNNKIKAVNFQNITFLDIFFLLRSDKSGGLLLPSLLRTVRVPFSRISQQRLLSLSLLRTVRVSFNTYGSGNLPYKKIANINQRYL